MQVVPVVHKPPIYIGMFGINYCYCVYINVRNNSKMTVLVYVLKQQGTVIFDSLSFGPMPVTSLLYKGATSRKF